MSTFLSCGEHCLNPSAQKEWNKERDAPTVCRSENVELRAARKLAVVPVDGFKVDVRNLPEVWPQPRYQHVAGLNSLLQAADARADHGWAFHDKEALTSS